MRLVKVLAVMLGIFFALAGLALVTSAGFVLGVYGTQRDESGYFTTSQQEVGSNGFALTAPDINSQFGPRWERWVPGLTRATVRISGESLLPTATPLFIGVAPTDRVSEYLSGVPRDRISRIDLMAGSVEYDHVDGSTLPSAPGRQNFWVAKAQGSGSQVLQWPLEEGDWTVVVMNGDASAPVAATMNVGARFGIMSSLVGGLVGGGALLLLIAASLLYLGARRPRLRPSTATGAARPPAVTWTPAQEGPGGDVAEAEAVYAPPQAPRRGARPPEEPPLWG